MRIVRRILWGIAIFIVLFCAIGLVLPKHSHVQRSIEIAAPPQNVFTVLNSFKRFNEWSPWFALDPHAQYQFSGPDTGVGARMEWRSNNRDVGNGTQQIIASAPVTSVTNQMQFGSEGPSTARFDLAPAPAGTKVTWNFDMDFGNQIVSRYFGLFFDRLIGPDFERGLAKLKGVLEAPNPRPAP
jgi:carbon monoxide dehydrogenase subunit G